VNGGTTGITFSRRVLAIVDPSGDAQDAVAFTNNLLTSPTTYAALLQGLQDAGDWQPANCSGDPCDDNSTPTANEVSAVWAGASGTSLTSPSVQRTGGDTDARDDWVVAPPTFGQ
jgi:hypothetical protein